MKTSDIERATHAIAASALDAGYDHPSILIGYSVDVAFGSGNSWYVSIMASGIPEYMIKLCGETINDAIAAAHEWLADNPKGTASRKKIAADLEKAVKAAREAGIDVGGYDQ